MKKLLPILLIGVMLFSLGIVAFAAVEPRMEWCSATGGSCEIEEIPGAHGWLLVCANCNKSYGFIPYE